MIEPLPKDNALKRGKSLSRSISTVFRKSKSRPTSPVASTAVPPTPRLPQDVRPKTSGSNAEAETIANLKLAGFLGPDSKQLKPYRQHHEESQAIKNRQSLKHLSLRQSRQKSWTNGDDSPTEPIASPGDDVLEAPSPPAETPTKVKKLKPKTSLRITASRISNAQPRSASATVGISKSTPASPQVTRPATLGAGTQSSSSIRPRGHSSPRNRHSKVSPDPFDLSSSPHKPWHVSYNPSEVRSSLRSAVTATSSRTTTTRNSIITKDTSLTEPSIGSPRPMSKDEEEDEEGLTVDEAIDMYIAGFTDDPEDLPDSRNTSLCEEEERRRSIKIAEAFNDNLDSPTLGRPSTSGSSRSRQLRSTSFGQPSLYPGASFPYGPSRDQYGFVKQTHHIPGRTFDSWYAEYFPSQVRRLHKWTDYMKEHKLPVDSPTKFPSRSAKTTRYIRKGIPPTYRGAAWFYYADGDQYLSRHPQLYNNSSQLAEVKLSDSEKEAIERDLHRTFPDNILFKPEHTESCAEAELVTSLRRVLRAFAYEHPKIGYCQSLNFIAALLLLFLPEEKAFWMLHIITIQYLPNTHETSLEGANVDLWVLAVAIKQSLPGVWAKIGQTGMTDDGGRTSRLPPISLCTTSWFMSLFIGTLPVETVLRVWDVLFYEQTPRILFRSALTIFKFGEQSIKNVGDSMELFQLVQGLPKGMIDANKFMEVACRKTQTQADWVERMRGERRIYFQKQREKAAGSAIVEDTGGENDSGVELKSVERKKSTWRNKKRTGNV